jgi:hypothetical protein
VVAVRIADDERARVPFALVGVLLLVASATTAATLAGNDPAPTQTRTDRTAERAQTGASVAVAGAARSALRATAQKPVVSPADGQYGAALSADSAFRDALALRIYARAERALREVAATTGDVTATVSLARVQSTADAERAIDRTHVVQRNDSRVRVTVEDVRVTLQREGEVVSRSRTNVSVTVESATLALHDRVSRFERLLDRGALAGPGLDRRLTDYLHRVVWLRGPLQYAGMPISNVLANRHVELTTNRALLSVQRSAFGRADDTGSDAYRSARARVGFTDVLAAGESAATDRAAAALERRNVPETPAHVGIPSAVETGANLGPVGGSRQSVPVGVNVTADRAFVEFVDGDGPDSLDGVLGAAYTSVGRRTVAVSRVDSTTERTGSAPENWTLAETTSDQTTRVVGGAAASEVLPPDYRRVSQHGRRIVATDRTTRRYVDGDRERTVVETRRKTFRVTVAVGYEVDPLTNEPLPADVEAVLDAPTERVGSEIHERIAADVSRRLVESAGGVDSLARRAVDGEQLNRDVLIRPEVPDSVRERARRGSSSLRDRARNVTANASTGALASGSVPVESLRNQVTRLHDERATYETVTDRALAAVRASYIAGVDERVADRHADETLGGVGEALGDRGVGDTPASESTVTDPGPIAAVDGSPAYLPLAEVDSELAPAVDAAYHPLAARNVNWFTIPHGDAANEVFSRAFDDPPETVGLGSAGQALRAANRTLSVVENETLFDRRERLQSAVAEGVETAGSAYRSVLYASNVSFSEAERWTVTRRAFARWPTLDARAAAVTNGSTARAVAEEAARVANVSTAQRDLLSARLRADAPTVAARSSVRVDAGLVQDAVRSARSVGRTVAKETLSHAGAVAAEHVVERTRRSYANAVPAGLPLAPVPGYWYATFNGWSVSVRGSWAKFAVRSRSGSPVGPGNETAFVREDASVSFDVDGDGNPERVGRNERLSFEVETTVGIVVPAGPQGVGDTNGERTESSPGW